MWFFAKDSVSGPANHEGAVAHGNTVCSQRVSVYRRESRLRGEAISNQSKHLAATAGL